MKLSDFAYHAPRTLAEAVECLSDAAGDSAVLAGGQSLVPMLAMRVAQVGHLVDIGRVAELQQLSCDGTTLTIGAAVTQQEALVSDVVRRACPLVCEALPHVGLRETRNRGTVVGSLVHADPAAELAAVALALDGVLVLRLGGEERLVPVSEFFVAPFMTVKAPGELVTELRLPVSTPGSGWAFHEIERGPFALVAVAAGVGLDAAGSVVEARLAFAGVGAGPVRARAAESFLLGGGLSGTTIDQAIEIALGDLDPPSDVLASAAYRRRAARELAATALREAGARAGRTA